MRFRLMQFVAPCLVVGLLFACSRDEPAEFTEKDGGPREDGSLPPPGTDANTEDSATPPPETFVTMTTEKMSFGNETRSYLLGIPKDYDANKSYPLVLSFHGSPSSAAVQAAGLPFDSVSKTNAVIVYPQADTDSWDLYTPTESNADMDWIHALPAEIATKANIDLGHVYGFGYSGGGFFLAQFTCRFGDVFKAISINAGGGPDEKEMGYSQYENGCYQCPGGPVATLVTHGANDTEVEPGSGEFTKNCFATFNGCGDTMSDSTPAPCQVFDGCPEGKPVKWCLIPGQSHAPWNQAMTEAWSFFTALP